MKKSKQSSGARKAAEQRYKKEQENLQTISALRRIIIRMQTAGLIFLLVGLFMHKIAPFYAEKSWNTLIGVKLTLPHAIAIFGCIMLIVSIFCFLRSYRCAKCGGLLALTPYTKVRQCRSCGAKVTDKDVYKSKGD